MPGSLRHLFGAMRPNRHSEVQALMVEAFDRPRTQRSTEYRMGVRALLNARLGGEKPVRPFKEGTSAFDAWHAGIEEGWQIWRNKVEKPAHQPSTDSRE